MYGGLQTGEGLDKFKKLHFRVKGVGNLRKTVDNSQKKVDNLRKAIEKDLKAQLKKNGTTGKYYLDLVDDYMRLWDIKNSLFSDISDRGVVTPYNNGGGQSGTKQNDSVFSVLKVSDRMTKILDNLGIKPSVVATVDDDDCDL